MIIDKGQPYRKLLVALFIIYLLLIPVWVLLLKSSCEIFYIGKWKGQIFASEEMIRNFSHYANLNPFKIFREDMLLNVAAFIPFGIYLEMLYHDKSFVKKTLTMALVSLAIEITQFTLLLGATDIVDLWANTLGGIIGLLLMRILYNDKGIKAVLIAAIFVTVIVAVGVGIKSVKIYRDVKFFYDELEKEEQLSGFPEYEEPVMYDAQGEG